MPVHIDIKNVLAIYNVHYHYELLVIQNKYNISIPVYKKKYIKSTYFV
jgi:hypothetical protein